LVHAADDYALAAYLKHEIEAGIDGCTVFVASKAGQIPTGKDWLTEVHDNLTRATSFLFLLTPRSVTRSWVWYEIGAAWHSGVPRFPVVAAGLARDALEFPLKALQALVLDAPADAEQLFTDLGGRLELPDAFCARVRALAIDSPAALPRERVQEIEEALGSRVGPPPKLLLRRMLSDGGLTAEDMRRVLEEPPRYVSDPVSIKKMLATLREFKLIEGDSQGRWRVKPDVAPTVRRLLEPSRLASQLLQLAQDLRAWTLGQPGSIDTNDFMQRFGNQIRVLREKAERDHGETDSWLDKTPSAVQAVRQIADALERIAGRV
jgi:hypothetical protein